MKKLLAFTAMAVIATAGIASAEEGKGPEGHGPGKMFEKIDADKDGVISKAEFIAKHEEMFAKMDTNGDGSLTKEEIETGREKWKEKHKEVKEGDVPPPPPAGEVAPKE